MTQEEVNIAVQKDISRRIADILRDRREALVQELGGNEKAADAVEMLDQETFKFYGDPTEFVRRPSESGEAFFRRVRSLLGK